MVGRVLGVMVAGTLLAAAPASAAELQAAYDYYEPGQGFQLGLKHAATGATLALPPGVNTADDELHPTLSPDGRFLAFTRMKLLPKLNGDIVPPQQRSLVSVNLQTGAIQTFGAGGVGPTYTQRGPGTVQLSWAAQPDGTTSSEGSRWRASAATGRRDERARPHVHAAVRARERVLHPRGERPRRAAGADIRSWTHAVIDPITGAAPVPKARLQLSGTVEDGRFLRLLRPTSTMPRIPCRG